ncbi:hypothetical protein LY76DRAFT_593572 [Colletotrichum caudatum]|nr:hypothetical protein LY76DRAFT_593572 [Colletotrichum caudatum]
MHIRVFEREERSTSLLGKTLHAGSWAAWYFGIITLPLRYAYVVWSFSFQAEPGRDCWWMKPSDGSSGGSSNSLLGRSNHATALSLEKIEPVQNLRAYMVYSERGSSCIRGRPVSVGCDDM